MELYGRNNYLLEQGAEASFACRVMQDELHECAFRTPFRPDPEAILAGKVLDWQRWVAVATPRRLAKAVGVRVLEGRSTRTVCHRKVLRTNGSQSLRERVGPDY